MTRIVSITRNAIDRDTRALKVGASIARFGYESVVIEGEPSKIDRSGLGFELLTLPSGGGETPPAMGGESTAAAGSGPQPPATDQGGLVARVGDKLPERVKAPLRPLIDWALDRFGETLYVLSVWLRDSRRLYRSLPPSDVYYIHSADQFPAAYVKALRSGARLVYDAHDANWALDPEVDPSAPSPGTLRMMKSVDRICARRVNGFLTVGAALADLLERHLGRRAAVVRNCHDFRLDEPSPDDVRSAAGVPGDAFLLVMTGAPKPGDTVEHALAALTALPDDVHLALVGQGTDFHAGLVASHGLTERVHLLDAVPPTQVASFIRTADASPILYRALSPAYLVSLPNRFFHAIAAGLPILYPPLPEIKALCDEHELGIEIDPESPDSIAAGVRGLADDAERRGRYAANVERAQRVLSWEHEEKALLRLLDEAIAG